MSGSPPEAPPARYVVNAAARPAAPTRRSATVRLLATAGIVGPAVFAGSVTAQQVARGDSYDATSQLVSDLTAGPDGWLIASFVFVVALARPADAPLHPWLGLIQRVILAVWLAAIVVLAVRLHRHTRRVLPSPRPIVVRPN